VDVRKAHEKASTDFFQLGKSGSEYNFMKTDWFTDDTSGYI